MKYFIFKFVKEYIIKRELEFNNKNKGLDIVTGVFYKKFHLSKMNPGLSETGVSRLSLIWLQTDEQ